MWNVVWNEVSKDRPPKFRRVSAASARQSQTRMLYGLRSFMLPPCGGRFLPGLHPRVALNCPNRAFGPSNDASQNGSYRNNYRDGFVRSAEKFVTLVAAAHIFGANEMSKIGHWKRRQLSRLQRMTASRHLCRVVLDFCGNSALRRTKGKSALRPSVRATTKVDFELSSTLK